jgi:bacillopeptidase F (M6 metalloprotease family)
MYSQDNYNPQNPEKIYDRFEVYVQNIYAVEGDMLFYDKNNASEYGCDDWSRIPGPNNPRAGKTTGWASTIIDLSDYQGQTVKISFQNHNRHDGWYNTVTFIDNIEVLLNP